ncbi:MAG: S1 RNA-binding domain-containing protein [Elusimicrobiota bacterium]|jgi:small subunit ribosomal protein S1
MEHPIEGAENMQDGLDEEMPTELQEAEGQTMENLLKQQGDFLARLDRRDVVWVKVVQSLPDNILVDIGEKHEAVIPTSEFPAEDRPAAGRRVPAVLVSRARGDKPTVLSTAKARWKLGWEMVVKAYEEKARVRGRVTSAVKGGFLVDVNGVTGFLPSSLADLRPVRAPQGMVGTGVRCQIIELNREKGQVVLSRRAVLEEETAKRKTKLLEVLKVGEIRIGRVVRVTEPGLFVDIGGLEALLPTAEIAWKDAEAAKAKFERGQKVRARVLRIEKETGKVSLGLKQLTAHPADAVRKRHPVKSVVKGVVAEILPDGVRIKLSEHETAFCELLELPVEGVEPPQDRFERRQDRSNRPTLPPLWPKVGEDVGGIVMGIHPTTFEVTISLKRYEAIQDRKRVAQYMKAAPPLTLGQLLNPGDE